MSGDSHPVARWGGFSIFNNLLSGYTWLVYITMDLNITRDHKAMHAKLSLQIKYF